MRTHASRRRTERRHPDPDAWIRLVDNLAMSLCPDAEWQAYHRQIQQLAWQAATASPSSGGGSAARPMMAPPHRDALVRKVRVFPVWRKYRQQALRVATLQENIPLLRHLPLRLSCILGDVLLR